MNQRANELIKSIPDLRYDASTGMFETDRRALYDLVELTVRECAELMYGRDENGNCKDGDVIKKYFGVEE
jgi:hypothetical protein